MLLFVALGQGASICSTICMNAQATAAESTRQTALALEQQGKIGEAETAWRAIEKNNPSDSEPYARLGLLEARQEHYKQAIPLYRKALALNPAIAGLRLNLGLALFKDGDLKGAIEELSPLLKNATSGSPEAYRLHVLVGMAHYGLGEYKDAVPYLTEAAGEDKDNLALRLALAHSCLWSKQYQCVLDTYHEILALNADSAEADMLAGEALNEMKDDEGAIREFRSAVRANPKEPDAHFGLGYLLWTQKQYKEAVDEFHAELANDPSHVQSMVYLADTEIQLDEMNAAQPLLEKAVKLDASLSLAHLDLGIVYTEDGKRQEALREFTAAAKLNPGDVDVHWRLGRLYRSMGKMDEAKAEFDKAGALHKAVDDDLLKRMNPGSTPANATKLSRSGQEQ
jgi:tetratricopeptide (TPR) repeat protein